MNQHRTSVISSFSLPLLTRVLTLVLLLCSATVLKSEATPTFFRPIFSLVAVLNVLVLIYFLAKRLLAKYPTGSALQKVSWFLYLVVNLFLAFETINNGSFSF